MPLLPNPILYPQLVSLLKELQRLQNALLVNITHTQKKRFLFRLQKEEKIFFLYLRLDRPYMRVHLIENIKPFSHFIPLTLPIAFALLKKIELHPDDRIIEFSLMCDSNDFLLTFFLFPPQGSLKLTGKNTKILYGASLKELKKAVKLESKPSIELSSLELEAIFAPLEEKELIEKEKQKQLKGLLHKENTVQQEIQKQKHLLKEAFEHEERAFEASLLQTHYSLIPKGSASIYLKDWRREDKEVHFLLDPRIPLSEEIKKRFSKASKLKRSIPFIQKRLSFLETKLQEIQEKKERMGSFQTYEDLLPCLKNTPEEKRKVPKKEETWGRHFISSSGLDIYVGRSARENEKLTFEWAKGRDLWFHVDGATGSHVILCSSKTQKVDDKSIEEAMQLAKHFSSLKKELRADMVKCYVKDLQKPKKGKPGQVVIKERKIYTIQTQEAVLKRLFLKK